MSNKNKALLYLALGLGVVSATLLIDGLILDIPNWFVIILMVLSVISLVTWFVKNKEK